MYKTQDVVSEAQYPQLGGNDNAGPTEWLPALTVREEVNRIIRTIAAQAGTYVTVDEVLGKSRQGHVLEVRHRAMVEVYRRFPWMSYPQMGRLFRRDHSSIMSALRRRKAWKPRLLGCSGRNIDARLYAQDIDYLFVRIGAALSVSAIPTEGANPHETA